MAGVGVEQMFYTLQAGLWWGDCGGNVLHLHLICANNDDKHAVNRATAILRLNEEEAAYLVMELVTGGSMRGWLRSAACLSSLLAQIKCKCKTFPPQSPRHKPACKM